MHGFTVGRRGGEGLHVAVRSRAYPAADDFWDGNWLVTPVTARFGGFHTDVPAALLRANEIEHFRDELRALQDGLARSARLSSLELWVDLTVTGDDSGRLEVAGELRDRPGSSRRLALVLDDYDRTDLPPLLDELDGVLADFPVRGGP